MSDRKIAAIMFGLIAVYLCIEVPFSGYLMRLVATGASQDEISTIEKFGRVLTGVALFLAVLGGSLLPFFRDEQTRAGEKAGMIAVAAVLTIGGTYGLLWAIGTYSPLLASQDDLKRSHVAVLAQSEARNRGFDGMKPDLKNPAWNAFVSSLPVITDNERVVSMLGAPERLAASEITRQLGTADQFRARFFDRVSPQIDASYAEYRKAHSARKNAISSIPEKANEEWSNYVSDLRKRFPEGIPERGFTAASIRNKVRARLPVSSEWPILDKGGFVRAYHQVAAKEIERQFSGMELPAGLSLSQFWKSQPVQKQIAQRFRVRTTAIVSPDMSAKAFVAEVYRPIFAEALATIQQPTQEQLEDAHRIATLPTMALLLSLAGAALHVFKITGYAARCAGIERSRNVIAGFVLIAGTAAMFLAGDSITTSTVYPEIASSGIYPQIVQMAIKIQPAFDHFANVFRHVGIWQAVESIIVSLS